MHRRSETPMALSGDEPKYRSASLLVKPRYVTPKISVKAQ